ncbi:MAG: hypothetical protein ABJB69_01210 [Spartobacteria bacterium]
MNFSRILLALFFVVAGVNHFVSPKIYLSIMPPYFPWPVQLVALSGAAEIAGGVGVLFSQTRKLAGWFLLALLLAVFPANIQAIATGMVIAGHALPNWMLWLRLPLQVVLMIWVYRACVRRTVGV